MARAADGRRTVYLDKAERRKLLDATDREAAPFVLALCLLPLRPGALAKLAAADCDKRTATVTIGQDRNGRPRQITVPQSIRDFLAMPVTGKAPADAKLPPGVSAYTLRHSVITDLVRGGLPFLTVAQLSGTSVAMIERHYGHLVRDDP